MSYATILFVINHIIEIAHSGFHGLSVFVAKGIVALIAKTPSERDLWYERLFMWHKKLQVMIHSHYFARKLETNKLIPIIRRALETKDFKKIEEYFYLIGEQAPTTSIKRRILILASGMGVRWEASHLKQLAPIHGKPLIEHLISNVPEAIVVSHHTRLHKYPHIVPYRHYFVLETILCTMSTWEDRTIILLGDTLYDHADLEDILSYDGNFAVFGSKSQVEIFALTFTKEAKEEVLTHLLRALLDAYEGGRGKITEMYRSYDNLPLYKVGFGSNFHNVNYTTDIDSLTEYEAVKEGRSFKIRYYEEATS